MHLKEIKVQAIIRRLFLIFFILVIGGAYADEQQVAQYIVNSLNAGGQTQSILANIKNLNVTRVSINYYGAMIYLANEVRYAINQSYNSIPVEMNSLNPYMTYATAQVIVNLFSNQQPANEQPEQPTGNFFNYDSEPKGFFNYGDQ